MSTERDKAERDLLLNETEALTRAWIDRGVKMISVVAALTTFAASIAVSHGLEREKFLGLAARLYDACAATKAKST